jgi:hypothetical protein
LMFDVVHFPPCAPPGHPGGALCVISVWLWLL